MGKLANSMWDAHVDFDLAAFHSHVRILKRTLRELTEASLCNILLQDFSQVGSLPTNLLNPSDNSDHDGPDALLPTFMLPRTCMGVVWKHVLSIDPRSLGPGKPSELLKQELRQKFPCCTDPISDLKTSLNFWSEVFRCVSTIAEPLGALDFQASMAAADTFLKQKCQIYGI